MRRTYALVGQRVYGRRAVRIRVGGLTELTDSFDVIIVGARCAGSPLAALLARQGVKVALVERATFPRDTLSTHIFEADALAFLDRLGVTDQLRATGAPCISRLNVRSEDFRFSAEWPQRVGDVGGSASIRRFVLDPILVQAAEESGAQVRMATAVTGLVQDNGRVTGVRISTNGSEGELRARLVVGADGRNSTVANLVEARKYNLVPNERFAYWAFFEDADTRPQPTHVFHRWAERFVIATPCDNGLYQVLVVPDLGELPRFRADLERSFMEYARSCEPVAGALTGAKQVGKFFGMLRWVGFFREPCGPGWVLVGDAGHFKDPSPGRGIGDAFCQVDALVPAIVAALDGFGDAQDARIARWGRWRDREFAEHYWFANDLGKAGRVPAVLPQMICDLHAKGQIGRFLDLFTHREKPSRILSPARLVGSAGRLLRHHRDRRAVLNEVRTLVGQNAHRQLLNHRRAYATLSETAQNAGPTEVEHSAAT
jgi:2-polyprenyl-6-methoxyphenol hydroxylase-like FAD-dependent oxidoreductase